MAQLNFRNSRKETQKTRYRDSVLKSADYKNENYFYECESCSQTCVHRLNKIQKCDLSIKSKPQTHFWDPIPKATTIGYDSWSQFTAIALFSYIFFIPLAYFPFLFTPFWFPAVLYVIWISVSKTAFLNGRFNRKLRNSYVFKEFAKYFSAKLICEEPLDETKNYLFSYSPHGLIALGAFLTFGTNGTDFERHYKRPVHLLTIDLNFYFPIVREFLMSLGLMSCSKKTMQHNLKNNTSLAIVLGGAAEVQFLDDPNDYNVIVDKRYGFFKLAIQNGVDIVPVFTFGENGVHDVTQIKNPMLKSIQQYIKKKFGFLPILFSGSFGLLPHRVPLTTVLGRPISVDKILNPTPRHVKSLQTLYKEELTRIFQKYQPIYGKEIKSLNFV